MTAVEALRRRPFLAVAAPLAAGIALSQTLSDARLFGPSLGAIAVLALLSIRWRRVRLACWILIGLSAGAARAEWARMRPPADVGGLDRDVEVRVTGRVLEAPRFSSPTSGSFPMELESGPWTGRVRVQFYRELPELIGGETISVAGKLRPLPRPSNPGVFDRAIAMERQGLGATLTPSLPVAVVTGASGFRLATWTDRVRSSLRNLLAQHAPPEVAALQAALLLGSREELPEDLTLALQRSGTAHFLAVSGFNLVIVLVIFWFLLLACGVRGPAMPAALLAILLAYTALTGWQVSVVRAFLMSAAVLGARLVWRRSDVVNSLCLAALVILLWDPWQLFDTGFQLSFVAVLGIVAIGPIYHAFLAPPPGPPAHPAPVWIARQARGALSVSIGAWLATAPIVLATFNLVTPVILAANLALCPLITVQSYLALAALPLAAVFPPGADFVGGLATSIFAATTASATFLTQAPAAYLFLPTLPAWGVAAYYAGLAAWTWRARVRPDRAKPWLCGVFAIAMAIPPLFARTPANPIIGLIDVGRGSCAYVRNPDGSATVFDCGSLSYRDPGAGVAAPVLWSQGISRVHTLVLSHADADHVNGARSLIERMRVSRLVIPHGFEHPLIGWARDRGIEVVMARRGENLPDLEVLGPPMGSETWPANERSLVVRATTPHGTILIPGDIEEMGTKALLTSGVDLRADILVLPHHGKQQELHRELIAAVAPRVVLVSAPEGYGSREVLDHAKAAAFVYQTGAGGWTEVELSESGLFARQFREP